MFRKPATADHIVSAQYTASGQDSPAPELTILKAEYGVLSGPSPASADITARVAARVKDGCLTVKVGHELAGCDPSPMVVKEMRLEYRYRGRNMTARVAENEVLELPEGEPSVMSPAYELSVDVAGQPSFHAWQPGKIEAKTASGKTLKAEVTAVPAPLDVSGPWELNFPPNWGAPASIVLPQLISWTDHPNSGVKYFSGTATYVKEVEIPERMFGAGHSIWLSLGNVKNIAEVSVNGKPLGVEWKPPFRADITDVAKPGRNRLEIKITNLWPNRLIGDEQLPPDCEWTESLAIKEWPEWLLEGLPSPTGRLTFTTWHHWKKDDKPLPSGLLGPVTLNSSVKASLK